MRPEVTNHSASPDAPRGAENLTEARIKALEPREKDYFVKDAAVRGLWLKVTPTGRKVYLLRYRNAQAQQRKHVLGTSLDTPLAEARKRATTAWGQLHNGKDPQQDRAAARSAITVSEFADRYVRDHIDTQLKEKSRREYRAIIKNNILPSLGRKPLASVTRLDLIAMHTAMRNRPVLANRALAVIKAMFNKAQDWEVLPRQANPAARIKLFKEVRRVRHYDAGEMARIGQSIARLRLEYPESASAFDALTLLFLTGCRTQEVLRLSWDDIDIARKVARLRDTKTAPRALILSDEAVRFLEGLKASARSPWVFPGKLPGHHLTGLSRPWDRLRKAACLQDARIHDIRHTLASHLSDAGSLQSVQFILGHSSPLTSARYAHPFEPTIRNQLNSTTQKIWGSLMVEDSD